VAPTGEGLDPLVAALEERRAAAGSDQALARRRARAVAQLVALVAAAGARAARDALAHDPDAARLADAVAARTLDPVSAAEALMARLGRG
jgi:putative protein kinase ArgK-like GTPase of G3E family